MSENQNQKQLKKLSLLKLKENQSIECTVERIVRGRFGRQPIATVDDIEFFLPGHTQLVRKVEETGIHKKVRITLVKYGSKTQETEYEVVAL